MVSHELRTPLTVLQILVERFHTEIAINPGQRDLAERMNVATQRLTRLVDTMLEYTRIESGRAPIERVELDLAPVITAAVEDVRPAADKKGLALRATIPELPPVYGDTTTIELILSNLLHNAIKFTDQGSVEVRAAHIGDTFELSVVDSGFGIAPEDQKKIFEEFQQVDSTSTRKKGGTGLGLSISRKIVELHGGAITVDSEIGKGSTFKVTIPVHVAAAKEAVQ
jgi:signal transduction histidine kinase